MPVLNGQEWSPTNIPSSDQAVEQAQEQFFVRVTGEVFDEYETYLERLRLLNSQTWSCAYSGKRNLTYMEAKQSEDAWDKVLTRIPPEIQEKVVRCIHHNRENLDELINFVQQELRIQNSPKENEPQNRSKTDIPKRALRAFIHKVSRKVGPQKQGVWLVKDDWCDKYGLQKELPVALGLELALWQKQRAKRSGAAVGLKDDSSSNNKKQKTASVSVTVSGIDTGGVELDDQNMTETEEVNKAPSDSSPQKALINGIVNINIKNVNDDQIPDHEIERRINEIGSKIRPNTLKHAAFVALKDKGLQGLTVDQVLQEIQDRNLMPEDYQFKDGSRSTLQQHLLKGDIFARVAKGKFALICLPGVQALNFKTVGKLDESPSKGKSQSGDEKVGPSNRDTNVEQQQNSLARDETDGLIAVENPSGQLSIVEIICAAHEHAAEKLSIKIQEQVKGLEILQKQILKLKNSDCGGDEFENGCSLHDEGRQKICERSNQQVEMEKQFRQEQQKLEALSCQLECAQKSVKEAKELIDKQKMCSSNGLNESTVLTQVHSPKFPMEDTDLQDYLILEAMQSGQKLPSKDVFVSQTQIEEPLAAALGDFLGVCTLLSLLAKPLEMTFATPNSTTTYRALKQLQFKELFTNFVRASTNAENLSRLEKVFNFLEGEEESGERRYEEAFKNVGRVYAGIVGWLLMEMRKQKMSTRLDRRWRLAMKDETWPEIVLRFIRFDIKDMDNGSSKVDDYLGIGDALISLRENCVSLIQHGILLRYLCDRVMESESFRSEILYRLESADEMTRETRDLITENKKKLKQLIEEERELKRAKRLNIQENGVDIASRVNNQEMVQEGVNVGGVVSADIRSFFKQDIQEGSGKLDLPAELQEYTGDPDDKKALVEFRQLQQAARKELQVMQARLEQQRREASRQQQREERESREREKQRENMKESMSKHQENLEVKLEKFVIRYNYLGADRMHRRYWWGLGSYFGCIFVENIGGQWGVLSTLEQIDQLIESLDQRGEREKELKETLEKRYVDIEQQFHKSLVPQSQVSVKQIAEHSFSIPERFQPSRRAKVQSAVQKHTVTEVFVEAAKEGFVDRFQFHVEDEFQKSCFVLVVEQVNKLTCFAMDNAYPAPPQGWQNVLEEMVHSVNSIVVEADSQMQHLEQLLNALRQVLVGFEDYLFTSSGFQFRVRKRSETGSDDEDEQSQGDEDEAMDVEDGSSVAATTSLSGVDIIECDGVHGEWVENEDERTANQRQKKPRKIPWCSLKERNSWLADLAAAKTPSHLAYCSSVFYMYSKPIFAFYEPPPPPQKTTRARML